LRVAFSLPGDVGLTRKTTVTKTSAATLASFESYTEDNFKSPEIPTEDELADNVVALYLGPAATLCISKSALEDSDRVKVEIWKPPWPTIVEVNESPGNLWVLGSSKTTSLENAMVGSG
jgi:hypothetical protein